MLFDFGKPKWRCAQPRFQLRISTLIRIRNSWSSIAQDLAVENPAESHLPCAQ